MCIRDRQSAVHDPVLNSFLQNGRPIEKGGDKGVSYPGPHDVQEALVSPFWKEKIKNCLPKGTPRERFPGPAVALNKPARRPLISSTEIPLRLFSWHYTTLLGEWHFINQLRSGHCRMTHILHTSAGDRESNQPAATANSIHKQLNTCCPVCHAVHWQLDTASPTRRWKRNWLDIMLEKGIWKIDKVRYVIIISWISKNVITACTVVTV